MPISDYARVAKAIAYIEQHVTAQPALDDIARHVHLSPYHFQRLFLRWAGTTPKRFLQVLTLGLGKDLLDQRHSILAAAHGAGLSSASRLHDHFVQLEAMSPGEYLERGAGMEIRYGISESRFGRMFVARTPRGICRAAFLEDGARADALAEAQADWPRARWVEDDAPARKVTEGLQALLDAHAPRPARPVVLHLAGTNFQLAVWRALLRIAPGQVVSYGELAAFIGKPGASRATGGAIGANPVACLIPCHRVIRQSGALGGYRWGSERKRALQTWEKLALDKP